MTTLYILFCHLHFTKQSKKCFYANSHICTLFFLKAEGILFYGCIIVPPFSYIDGYLNHFQLFLPLQLKPIIADLDFNSSDHRKLFTFPSMGTNVLSVSEIIHTI